MYCTCTVHIRKRCENEYIGLSVLLWMYSESTCMLWFWVCVSLHKALCTAPLHVCKTAPCTASSLPAMHHYTTTKLQHCTNTPMHHYINAPLHQCTTASLYHCINAPLHQCTTELLKYWTIASRHRCTTTRLHRCTTASMHYWTTQILHHCITASMHHYTTALLHHSIDALLNYSETAPLHHSIDAPPHDCTAASLQNCPVAALHHDTWLNSLSWSEQFFSWQTLIIVLFQPLHGCTRCKPAGPANHYLHWFFISEYGSLYYF